MQNLDLGYADIDPKGPVVAGSFTTITYTYTAGHPIDDSGYLKIVFRIVNDFGTPQFDDPTSPNYCTVSTTGDCQIEPRWDRNGHTRPWKKALFLTIRKGFLNSGEKIVVVFGDTSGGSPGWQVQTFCIETFEFKTLVDPIATYQFKELTSSPFFSVVPGPPVRAVCVAPSQVRINEAFVYHLKLEDKWGNPTESPQRITHPGLDSKGIHTIIADDKKQNLSAQSNPIDVLSEDAPLHPYWSDFHGQTGETVGSGSIEEYFNFARDYGFLDIAAHQGNDFEITDAFWEKINRITKACYKLNSFVTFPGYEWSGNTSLGGDRNVYFASEGGRISRSCTDLLPNSHTVYEDSPTATDLFQNLGRQDGPESFVFAHVGGRYADMSMHDPSIEIAVEIHSAWGTFEWLAEEALRRGYRIGICANSDGHKCRPGASYPGAGLFGSLGGLTCVLARKLDREHVLEALKSRHFYATTGNRCLMDVKVITKDARSGIMGDVIEVGPGTPELHGRVVGTAPVDNVQIYNGTKVVKVFRPYSESDLGGRLKIVWRGAEVRGRDRVVRWDGGLQVRGNTVSDATPINFWNILQPLKKIDNQTLSWKSMTTGGVAGVILSTDKSDTGMLHIETFQKSLELAIASIGLEPKIIGCGGLQKTIETYRLPDRQESCEFSFTLPLKNLQKGDNPIYIRMTQEDGHMAWSSPVYLVWS
jgi:hypothetical protein